MIFLSYGYNYTLINDIKCLFDYNNCVMNAEVMPQIEIL